MSVTSALYTGVSGLMANAEGINIIGNNLSNVNTVGFKGARIGFADLLSVTVGNTVGSNNQVGRGTQIQKIDNEFGQGSFETTQNVTDLAIQGDSFFVLGAVDSVAGTAVAGLAAKYTRAAAFRMTPDSAAPADTYLTNPDGLRVLDEAGMPIRFLNTGTAAVPVATDFVKITSIDPQGRITFLRQDGASAYYTGVAGGAATAATALRIGTLNIVGKNYLEKMGGTVFQATSAQSGVPIVTGAGMYRATYDGTKATSEKIFSSSLEQSNVDMAAQFVKMILTQRAYSANSKTITTADEMTQELLGLKR
ncbi:MAG TPA: flagellar hook-basal body complex protein [Desulfuromonadales bacterium]|nr:flagellar hook-basal body complex protein [Desulfuromonadales bacterium]